MKLKQFKAWVIKHKRASFPVVNGLYLDYEDAKDEYDMIPEFDNNGCGKRDDYELIEVIVKEGQGGKTR